MKTYDLYGALPDNAMPERDLAASVTALALRVQSALGIDVFAREGRNYSDYRADDVESALGAVFIGANVCDGERSAPCPESRYPLVVGISESADPERTQASLEPIGLTLVRRRRRGYALPRSRPAASSVDLYGAPTSAADIVQTLVASLRLTFDGNEHAASGGDSHYYDESVRFGTLLVFDNVARPFDEQPFPQYPDTAGVVVAINSPEREALKHLLMSHGFTLLKSAGVEAQR